MKKVWEFNSLILKKISSPSQKRIQFFASWFFQRQRIQFFESILSRIQRKFQFFESYSMGSLRRIQKKFNSLNQKKKNSTLIEKKFMKEAQFESFTKSWILWVIVQKKGSTLWVMKKQFFKKRSILFNGWVQWQWIQTPILWLILWNKSSILWAIIWRKVQFFESWKQERFNSSRHIEKKDFRVKVKRVQFLFESCFCLKNSILMSHIFMKEGFILSNSKKRVQFFASFCNSLRIWKKNFAHSLRKTPILRLILNKKVQFFEPYLKKSSILWFLEKISSPSQKGFNSLRHVQRQRIQFFASYSKKKGFNSLSRIQKRVQLFASYLKKELNSLTHIQKKINSLSHEKTILWVIFNEFGKQKILNKNSILWVILKERFNSLSLQSNKKGSLFESCFCLKNSILWVIFSRRFIFFKKKLCNFGRKKVQFFES